MVRYSLVSLLEREVGKRVGENGVRVLYYSRVTKSREEQVCYKVNDASFISLCFRLHGEIIFITFCL